MPEIRVDFAGGNDGRGWRVLDRYQRGVPGSEPQVIILGTTPSEAVAQTHGDDQHGRAYAAAIAFFRAVQR